MTGEASVKASKYPIRSLSRGFWTFFAAAFFFDFGFSIYFFFINLYLSALGFHEREIGFVSSALTAGSVVATIPVAYFARRLNLRLLLLVCFVAAPCVAIARLFVGGVALHITLALLAGTAMSLWAVCFAPTLARITTPENRHLAFSLVFAAGIGSSAFGGAICGELPAWLLRIGVHFSDLELRRFILLGSAIFAALGIAAVAVLRLPQQEPSARKRHWTPHPYLYRFLPAMALWSAATAAFVPFAGVYFNRTLGVSLAQVAFIFSASQLLQLLAGLAAPWLFRSVGALPGILYTQLATTLGLLAFAGVAKPHLAVPLYLFFTATQWMNSPGIYSLLMSSVPESEQTAASAMTNLCNSVVQAVGAALTGVMIGRAGYPLVIVGIACVATSAMILFCFLSPGDKPRTAVSLAHH